jgi:hypothetical protein
MDQIHSLPVEFWSDSVLPKGREMSKLCKSIQLNEPHLTVRHGKPFEWTLDSQEAISSWSEVWMEATDNRGERAVLVSRNAGLVLINEHAAPDFHHGRVLVEDTTTTTLPDTPPSGAAGTAIRVVLDAAATSRLLPSDEPLVSETYVRNGRGHLRCLDRRQLVVIG